MAFLIKQSKGNAKIQCIELTRVECVKIMQLLDKLRESTGERKAKYLKNNMRRVKRNSK